MGADLRSPVTYLLLLLSVLAVVLPTLVLRRSIRRLGGVRIPLAGDTTGRLAAVLVFLLALSRLKNAFFWRQLGFVSLPATVAAVVVWAFVLYLSGRTAVLSGALREGGVNTIYGGVYPWARIEGFAGFGETGILLKVRCFGGFSGNSNLRFPSKEARDAALALLTENGVQKVRTGKPRPE